MHDTMTIFRVRATWRNDEGDGFSAVATIPARHIDEACDILECRVRSSGADDIVGLCTMAEGDIHA